jgi:hypothetical protein
LQLCHHGRAGRFIAIGDDHMMADSRQPLDHVGANPHGTTGHDGDARW